MRDRYECRAYEIEERDCVECEWNPFRMCDKERGAEDDKKEGSVDEETIHVVDRCIRENNIGDRITRLLGCISDGIKRRDEARDESKDGEQYGHAEFLLRAVVPVTAPELAVWGRVPVKRGCA